MGVKGNDLSCQKHFIHNTPWQIEKQTSEAELTSRDEGKFCPSEMRDFSTTESDMFGATQNQDENEKLLFLFLTVISGEMYSV